MAEQEAGRGEPFGDKGDPKVWANWWLAKEIRHMADFDHRFWVVLREAAQRLEDSGSDYTDRLQAHDAVGRNRLARALGVSLGQDVEAVWREIEREVDGLLSGLGSCRICDRPTDGVTICRYCDRMMEHLDGVIQYHRDKLKEKRDEAGRRYKSHGDDFTRGKRSAYSEMLEAFPVATPTPEADDEPSE